MAENEEKEASAEGEKKADGAAAAPAAAPATSGRNPLVAVMLLINAILIAGVAFLQYQAHVREASKPSIRDVVKAQMLKLQEEGLGQEGEHAVENKNEGLLLPLETFTANLAQGDGPRRFLRMTSVLKFSSDSKAEEFKTRSPQIRDAIISIINSKRPEDLLKVEGKSYLKEEIKAAINSFLIDGHVEDVYYVSFQIQ